LYPEAGGGGRRPEAEAGGGGRRPETRTLVPGGRRWRPETRRPEAEAGDPEA